MFKAIRRAPLACALLSTTAIVMPLAAHAQSDGAPAAEETSGGDIIVTAQRRSESLQKVPLSINVLGEAKLKEQNVASFDDYAKILPSVSFQSFGPSQSQIFFRGVSSGGDGLHIGPLPTSSMYIDDIPVTTIGGTVDFHVYDIARVEALAGPQGTLFGASSLSGVLRLITNKPDPSKFSASVDGEVNKYSKGDFGGSMEGYVNIPLNESMALRMSGFYEKLGGYIDNIPGSRTFTLDDGPPVEDTPANASDPGNTATSKTVTNAGLVKDNYNDVETYGGRAALGIDLDGNWSMTPSIIYQHQKSHGGFLYDPKKGYLKVTDYLPSSNKDEWYQAALTITGKLSDWDVTYSAGYFGRKVDNRPDYSYYSVAYDTYTYTSNGFRYHGYATYYPDPNHPGEFLDPTQNAILKDKYTKFTQELRVASPTDKPFRLTAGAFMQIQTDEIFADYNMKGFGSVVDPIWLPQFADGSDTMFRTRIRRKDQDYAVFAQAEYDIVPNVTLIAGGRAFMAHNTIFGFSGTATAKNCLISTPSTDPAVPCFNVNKAFDQSGAIYKAGIKYQMTPDVMVYATLSRGYRPGGNNRRPGVDPFTSDTLDNYEVGWKTRFGPITFNGAAFYEKWKNLQFGLVPLGQNGVTNTYNAGDARIYGIEGDISTRLGGLTLSAAGTYVDAKLSTDFCQVDPVTKNIVCAAGEAPAAAKGTRLPIMPKFKGNATARYEVPVGSAKAYAQGTVSHQGGTRSFLTDADFAAVGPTKGFTTVDFSLGMNWDHYRVSVFLENAFNSKGTLSLNTVCATQICGQYSRAYPTKPQFFGIKVGYDY